MLSEPRTQMRGRSELLAAMFGDIAVWLGELGSDGEAGLFRGVVTWLVLTW